METLVLIALVLLLLAVMSWLVYRAKFEVHDEDEDDFEGDTVKIITSDEVAISADYLDAPGAKFAVILVHMMPSDKMSWREFSLKLKKNHFASIAIDLRGHGFSEGGPRDYRNFSDEEHQKSILDIRAASDFLAEKGYEKKRQFIVGASVGANLALQFMAENHLIKAGALLSPGLNYNGIKAMPLIYSLKPGQFVLVAASEDDKRDALEVKSMMIEAPEGVGHKTVIYKRAGHGTNMFGKEKPDLEEEIIKVFKMMAGLGGNSGESDK